MGRQRRHHAPNAASLHYAVCVRCRNSRSTNTGSCKRSRERVSFSEDVARCGGGTHQRHHVRSPPELRNQQTARPRDTHGPPTLSSHAESHPPLRLRHGDLTDTRDNHASPLRSSQGAAAPNAVYSRCNRRPHVSHARTHVRQRLQGSAGPSTHAAAHGCRSCDHPWPLSHTPCRLQRRSLRHCP